ncbi:MAG: DUF1194 domain-containing protein [Rhodospirillales bacterium]|nr:DUF1194 domain-containing protein [Rhodospirillales bacterium]
MPLNGSLSLFGISFAQREVQESLLRWSPVSRRLEVYMMRYVRLASLALFGALVSFNATAEEMSTDANIITGLDVSSSINAQETMLQIEGMAQAIRSPAIVAAIQHGRHGRIGFAVFVWADGDYPELVSWRVIGTAEDAEATSQEITGRLQSLIDSSRARSAR